MADKSLYDVCEQLKANSDRNTALLTTLNSSVLKLNNMMGWSAGTECGKNGLIIDRVMI